MIKIYKIKTNGGNEYVAEIIDGRYEADGCWVASPQVADMFDNIGVGIWGEHLDWTNWGEFFPDCKIDDLYDNLNGYECDDPQIVEEREVDE